jgi:hypothetical protein
MKNTQANKIDQILEELFELDPELKSMKEEVEEVVKRLLEQKMEVSVDKKFVSHLREELLVSGMDVQEEAIESISISNLMKKMTFALGGSAMLAALLLVAVSTFTSGGFSLPGVMRSVPSDGGRVVALGPQAFGSLSGVIDQAPSPEAGAADQRVGYGGGGGMPKAVSSEAYPTGMIAPQVEYKKISFNYVGEQLEGLSENVEVYRRIKDLSTASLARAFAREDNGLFELSGLSGLQMSNASLTHVMNGKKYWVYLDFREAQASMNLQEERVEVMPAAQELPDSELIAIADDFLRKNDIDTSAYGEPEVDDRWRMGAMMEERAYYPTYVGVVYPLIVGGEKAVSWDGEAHGLRVNVNAALKEVQGVNMISTAKFESSQYPAVTDTDRIMRLVSEGGFNGPMYMPEGTKPVIDLGTPSVMYLQYYVFNGKEGTNEELYLPALFFPIQDSPEDSRIYRNYVVVPLVGEILDQREEQMIGVPEPMPLIEPAMMGEVRIKE